MAQTCIYTLYVFLLQAEVRRSALLGLDVRGMLNVEAADSQVLFRSFNLDVLFSLTWLVVFIWFLTSSGENLI